MKITITILILLYLILTGCKYNTDNDSFNSFREYGLLGEWEGYYVNEVRGVNQMQTKYIHCTVKIDTSSITISDFIDIGKLKGGYFFENKHDLIIDTEEFIIHSKVFVYNKNQILIRIDDGICYPFYLTRKVGSVLNGTF